MKYILKNILGKNYEYTRNAEKKKTKSMGQNERKIKVKSSIGEILDRDILDCR